MVNLAALARKACRAIWHVPTALGVPYLGTKIGVRMLAKLAILALGNVQGNHMITWFEICDLGPNTLYYPSTLMAKYAGKDTLRVKSFKCG